MRPGHIDDLIRGLESFGGDGFFHLAQHKIHSQRQQTGRDCAQQHQVGVVGVEAHIDHPAQAACAGKGSNGNGTHRSNRRNADTSHNKRQSQRELDAQQLLGFGKADAAGSLQQFGVDAGDAGIGVLDDGQQGIDHYHDNGRLLTDAHKGYHKGQQTDAGNGLHEVGNADDNGSSLVILCNGDTDETADNQGGQNCQRGHFHVFDGQFQQFSPAFHELGKEFTHSFTPPHLRCCHGGTACSE